MHDKEGWNCQAKNATKGIKIKKIWEKDDKFYCQSVIVKRDAKKVYQDIGKETITVDDNPSIEEVKNF